MNPQSQPAARPSGPAAILLLSFRQRDELAAAVSAAGWRTIAARRGEAIERRFLASGASLVVVDARGAFDEGLVAVRALADTVEANAAALVVLLSRNDVPRLDAVHAAGATHYLASPFGDAELVQALRFAERHAERLAGGTRTHRGFTTENPEALWWRYNPRDDSLQLSPAMTTRFALSGARLATLYGLLDRPGRDAARGAARRLAAGAGQTAFAHLMPGETDRVAHHLHRDRDGIITGSIEQLGDNTALPGRGRRDAMTGLRDATSVRRWLDQRVAEQVGASLLLIAASRFELVNSAYGRAAGDTLIQAVARRIERATGEAIGRRGTVARMAGAEYAVLLDASVPLDRARQIAGEIADAVVRPFLSGEVLVTLGCHIGVATVEPGDGDGIDVLRRASIALAEARAAESGTIRLLSGAEAVEVARETRLGADLRNAIARDEIELLFQPQVAMATGEIVGVEALARWRHPEYGELGANTLFAAADRADYLLPLSEHVQAKAVRVAAAWPEPLRTIRLAINVTAADIARPNFAETFLAMVAASGFPPGRLTVEVTENGLIEDLGAAGGLLAALRAGGCRVAIDDFGTGYSSLAYLKSLPLDYLKIDKRLSQDIAGSTRDRIVVRGVIDMSRSLGLAVIAEGVETEEQLTLLAQEGCNFYQGFLCSEPVDVTTLAQLVRDRG